MPAPPPFRRELPSPYAAHRQWLLILAATVFNLAFEFSMRGTNNFFRIPLMLPVLFLLYFSLFTMVEDLIARYRLRDYHLVIAAFFYGTVYEFFATGTAVYRPGIFGVNWISVLFVNLVFWASLQGILTFYFANRVFSRSHHAPLLTRNGWTLAIALNLVALLLINITGSIPGPGLIPLFVLIVLLVLTGLVFYTSAITREKLRSYVPFRNDVILDLICLFSIVIFLFTGLVLTGDPVRPYTTAYNQTAFYIDIVWVVAVACIILIYRLLKGRPVPV